MNDTTKHEVHLTKEYASNGFKLEDFQKPVTEIADNFTLYDLFVLIEFSDGIIPDIAETLGMEEFDSFWKQIRLPRDPDDDDDIDFLELCWHPDYDILETPKTGKQTDQKSILADDEMNYWDNPSSCEISNLMSFHGVGSGCPVKNLDDHKCDKNCPNETSYGIWPCTLNNLAHLPIRVVPTVEFYPPYVESNSELERTDFTLTINPTLWCFITSILWELTFGGNSPNKIKDTIAQIKKSGESHE